MPLLYSALTNSSGQAGNSGLYVGIWGNSNLTQFAEWLQVDGMESRHRLGWRLGPCLDVWLE